ncbi:MAG: GIY-YIG nuclease family protein [Planctomycetota bacterium]
MDRRALIREYKESRRPMGVYRVLNKLSGRSLVGASTDLPAMLNRQRAQLRMGAHRNRALQSDWNALGADAFAFEVLDTLSVPARPDYDPSEDLRVLEELWLVRLSPFDERGYNARPAGR